MEVSEGQVPILSRTWASFSEKKRTLAGKGTRQEKGTLGSICLIPSHAPGGQTEKGMVLSKVMPSQNSMTETLCQATLSPLPGGIYLIEDLLSPAALHAFPQNHSVRLGFGPHFTDGETEA